MTTIRKKWLPWLGEVALHEVQAVQGFYTDHEVKYVLVVNT